MWLGEGRRAILLYDGFGEIDEILGDPRLRMVLDVRKESPAALDSLGADDVVIYACTQDDLGLPFIAHLHKTGRKYYPVWSAPPGGYVFTNTTAREVLKVEFEFQKREGFDKWDFGHRDFTTLIQALDLTKNLPGCYLEAGCYRGSSAGAVLRYLATTRRPMQAFFLDVFEGFQYVESKTSADAARSTVILATNDPVECLHRVGATVALARVATIVRSTFTTIVSTRVLTIVVKVLMTKV